MAEEVSGVDPASEIGTQVTVLRAQISELLHAQDPLGAAESAHALGGLLDGQRRYEDAVEAHLQAYGLRNASLGANDARTRLSCYEVGELSRVLCRFEEAEYFLKLALEAEDLSQGADEFNAKLLNNLAEVYTSLGRYDDAEPLFETALRLRVATGGADGERALRSRAAMAQMSLQRGGEAAAVVAQAKAALELPDKTHRSTWHLLLAEASLACGDTAVAIRIHSSFIGQVPPSEIGRGVSLERYLDVLRGLIIGYSMCEDWPKAIEAAALVPAIAQTQLAALLSRSAEVQVDRAFGRLLDIQALWLTALWRSGVQEGPAVDAAFGFVQMMKGLRTRYVRLRQPGNAQVLVLHAPQDAADLAERWLKIQELQDELILSRLAAPSQRVWERDFKTVTRRAQLRALERLCASGVDPLEVMLDLDPIGGAALPEATAGLEIVFVPDLVGLHRGAPAPVHHYLGFALGPGNPGAPQLVHFGLAAEVDRAAAELRRSITEDAPLGTSAPSPAWMGLADFLGRKLLQPGWQRISSANHLRVAADRAWATLPLDLLTTPEGQPLGERFAISGCMRLSEASRNKELVRRGGEPLVVAGPDFELPHAFTGARGRPSPHRGLANLLADGCFTPLPAAEQEGVEIARMLGVEPLTGVWAVREELLASGSPELMHIATHGFVLPSGGDDPFGIAAPIGNALHRQTVLDDPLQRSGLAFAGANAALRGRALPEAVGDGIVRAATIQQLNLQQTDLVYLSACRSGLGELAQGDGAHGLRRAFQAAGCRSVVATLWDIPDVSAMHFASVFYGAALAGRPRIEALREARDALKRLHPHDPLHWAGFVLDGDTGPLRRFLPMADLKVATLSFARWMAADGDPQTNVRHAKATAALGGMAGEPRTARALRQAMATAQPGDPNLVTLLVDHANMANRLGDHGRAIADYRRLLRAQGIRPEQRQSLRYNIAKIQQQRGRLRKALTGYTALLAEGPEPELRATVLVNRGLAFSMLGDASAALADLNAVIAEPSAPAIQGWMARVNRAQVTEKSDPAGSLGDIETALAMQVDVTAAERARARTFAAGLMLRTGQVARARREIEALEALPELDADLRDALKRMSSSTEP